MKEVTHPWMKITSNRSGGTGNGLINALEFSSGAGALNRVGIEAVDEPAISQMANVVVAVASEEHGVSV